MEYSPRYARVRKAAEMKRGGWMPLGRRGKIKRMLVQSCLAAVCCLCCFRSHSDDAEKSREDEVAMTQVGMADQGPISSQNPFDPEF
uniref:Uncharacterized protein n=1 Tax=Physcomitrium patens TaxID=3218 RepID=A0A2K1K377_PHYPA|nr:hypothetical protein PHYPA_012706 [Physcomitrium patens]